MAFGDIVDLAKQQAQEQERQRKAQLDDLAYTRGLAHLEDTGTGGYAAARPGAALSPDAQREADQSRMLNVAADKRFTERESYLKGQAPSTPDTVLTDWFGPAASTIRETPQSRQDELTADPRGRAERLSAIRASIAGPDDTGGATANAAIGGAGPSRERTISVGTGLHGEPYYTNLRPDELVREGAPIQMQSTEAGPQPELHAYAPRGGGGTLSVVGDSGVSASPQERAKQQLLQSLDFEIGAARNAKLTPRESASALLEHEPKWDTVFASSPYGEARQRLTAGIADGSIPPDTGGHLLKKYETVFNQASAANTGASPDIVQKDFAARLNAKRMPGPAADAAMRDAGPGIHAESEASALQARSAAQSQAATGPGTEVPPKVTPEGAAPLPGKLGSWSRPVGEAIRYGAPVAGDVLGGLAGLGLTGGLGAPALATAGGGIGGGVGDVAANWIEGEPQDAKEILLSSLLGAAPVPAMKGIGVLGRRVASPLLHTAADLATAIPRGVQGLRAAPGVAGAARYATGEMASGVSRAAQAVEEALSGVGRTAQAGEALRGAEGIGQFAEASRPAARALIGSSEKDQLLSHLVNPEQIARMSEAEKDELLSQLTGGARTGTAKRMTRGRSR